MNHHPPISAYALAPPCQLHVANFSQINTAAPSLKTMPSRWTSNGLGTREGFFSCSVIMTRAAQ